MGREMLCAIPYAPTRAEALQRRERFAKAFRRTHPKAVEILEKDWERMVAFYDFPKEQWKHLRTTNVVESPFAAVKGRRLRSFTHLLTQARIFSLLRDGLT